MLKNSFSGLSIKVGAAAIAFLTNILIANFLGPERSGFYYYLISFLGVMVSLSIFGGQTYILKVAPVFLSSGKTKDASELIIGVTARTMLLAFGLLVIVVLCIAMASHRLPDIFVNNPALPYLALSIPFLSVNVVLSHALQVQGRVVLAFLTSGFTHSVGYIAMIAIFQPSDSETLSALYLLICIATSLHLLFLNWQGLKTGVSKKAIKAMAFEPSYQFFIIQAGLELTVQTPILLLGVLDTSPDEISGYAIASRIALTLGFIYAVVNRIVLPQFSELYANEQWDELRRVFLKAVFLMSTIALPFAMMMLIFRTQILILFGDGFSRFSNTLFILVLFQILNVVTGPAGNLLIMADRQKLFRNFVIFGFLLVLLLSWLLIPVYDAFGAALANLLGYGFVNIISFAAALQIILIRKE